MAAVIVFGTTYSLILPAITVDQDSAEEMPSVYLEDEGFCEEDYDNAYEDVYDTEDVSENDEDADWSEEDQTMQDGQTNENASVDDGAPETDNNTDNAADDDTLATSTDSDDAVKTDDNDEAGDEPSYTYNNTSMETAVPVVTDLLGDVTFRIDYNSDAGIPDGSTLSAEEVGALAESDSDWSNNDAVYFDIELSDPEGNVSQPRSQISLTVNFTRPVYAEKVNLVRFRYDDNLEREVPELMNPVDCIYTEDGGIYSFVLLADDLSTLGVICGEVLTESMAESAAEPVMAESGTESAAESVLTDSSAEQIPDIATAYPAQDFEDSTGEVSVTVHAQEGAFPTGTSMSLKTVENDVIEDISEAVSDEKTIVKKFMQLI